MSSDEVNDVFQLVGTVLEARFEVDRAVAEGGFGVVYHAKQAALERSVALKVLKPVPRFGEAEQQRFLAGFATEAKTIARIAHPNIVHVYDFGVSAMPSGVRAAWMALEWLTGTTFEEELRRRRGQGGRSPSECLAMLKPVLSALATVHAGGIAHRDLKPANIMLVPSTEHPGRATAKLLDFGIAKIMDADETPGSGQTQTRSQQIAFSPGYAAPEQISSGRSGPWTDVHAMALILTEMLTDRAPFETGEAPLLIQQIVDRVRPTPAKFDVEVGPWEAVLRIALAVVPAERYRDAGELLSALERSVAEASAAFEGALVSSGGSPPARGGSLEQMPTQAAASGHGVTPQPHLTTSTPTSRAAMGARANRGRRVVPAVVVGGLGVVLLAAIGWRLAPKGPPVVASVPDPIVADAIAPAMSVVAMPSISPPVAVSAPPPPPSASTPSAPSPPASRSRPAPSRVPSRAPGSSAPPAASSAGPPKAAPSGKIVIE